MNDILHIIPYITPIVLFGMLVNEGYKNRDLRRKLKNLETPINITPQVIVNMPVDATPLEQLTPLESPLAENPTKFGNEKAILWWTVYKATIDEFDCEIYEAKNAANDAIDKCYPE